MAWDGVNLVIALIGLTLVVVGAYVLWSARKHDNEQLDQAVDECPECGHDVHHHGSRGCQTPTVDDLFFCPCPLTPQDVYDELNRLADQ